jgi:hypothetical protein
MSNNLVELDNIPTFLIVSKNSKNEEFNFLILNKEDKKQIPFFLNFKDAQNLLLTIKAKSYKIMVLGLYKTIMILNNIKKENKDVVILPHPSLEQINYSHKYIKSLNNKNFNFYKKIGNTYNKNKLEKLTENKEFIYSCNVSNEIFIDTLLNCIIKSKENVIDLLEDNFLFWSDYCKSLCFNFLYDIYGFKSDEIKDCYLIKYDSKFKTNEFHYDSCSICIRIFLNYDFENGGIEFRKEKYIFKPKKKGEGICYPGSITHFNRQLSINSGVSYVLTINIK